MLLTSVILILQETLEAALLVSILAAVTLQRGRRPLWLPWGIAVGCALAWLYAAHMTEVSEWFDYVGQELVNATLQVAIALVILLLSWRLRDRSGPAGAAPRRPWRFDVLCATTIALAVTREGSEILVYLGGFLGQDDRLHAVAVGSALGFGIGVSVGFLVFFGLLALRGGAARWVPLVLLALFAGNMLAQSALLLTQADWLQAGPTLWDSSALLPEQSVAGRLLYALVGYESRPSLVQVISYLAGATAVLTVAVGPGRRA